MISDAELDRLEEELCQGLYDEPPEVRSLWQLECGCHSEDPERCNVARLSACAAATELASLPA